jgi:hypothetical protein
MVATAKTSSTMEPERKSKAQIWKIPGIRGIGHTDYQSTRANLTALGWKVIE